MEALKGEIEKRGYIVQSLSWSEEDDMYCMTVLSPSQNDYQQTIIVGRNLIYASDFQKCLILNKKLQTNDKPPFKVFTVDRDEEAVVFEGKAKADSISGGRWQKRNLDPAIQRTG